MLGFSFVQSGNVYMVYSSEDDISTSPWWFPLYAKGDRKEFRKKKQLLVNGILAPSLWPVETPAVLVEEIVQYIYDHMIAFPWTHIYDEADMQHIVDVIERD